MKKALLFVVLCGTIVTFGCSKKEEPVSGQIQNLPDRNQAMSEPSVEKGPVQIGVGICDSFLEKYRKCVAELPDKIRGSMQKGLDRTEQAWKTNVDNSTDQNKLIESCKQMEASVSKIMKAQGCIW